MDDSPFFNLSNGHPDDQEKRPKLKLCNRIRNFIKKHKKLSIIVSIVIVILIGGLITFLIISNQKDPVKKATASKSEVKKVEVKYYSPLTGALVTDEATTKLPVTGVMIENSPEARPQSGIKNSGVVFEAIAEGGITRFLVLYQSEKPQLIGPVRSVRMYYVDWAAGFNAGVAHVGGSAEALAEIRNGTHRDLDQFFNSAYYWRSSDRYAPHNVYTSFEKLDELNSSKGYTTSNFTGFARTDEKASTTPTANNIYVTISSELFNSSYIYNAATNSYDRSQGGEAHIDREDGQISPKVVIALRVNETLNADGVHQEITTVGSGTAVVFQNGTATEVTWTKNSKTDQIKFTDAAGIEVPLVRGQTWISAVPNDGGSVIWN